MAEPRWARPEGIEREYETTLKRWARRLQRACNELLMPEVDRLVAMAKASRADDISESEAESDGTWSGELNAILVTVLGAAEGRLRADLFSDMKGPRRVDDIDVRDYARRVSEHDRRQIQRIVRRVYNENYSRAEPWLDDLIAAWERENLKLIRSIPQQYVDNLQGTVIRTINEGRSATDLKNTIRATYDQPVNRAKLISNDQIGKLHSNIVQFQQEGVGIREYEWDTIIDGRERAAHRRRNGETFKWSSPPSDGHPGTAVHCRCRARPIWPSRDKVRLQ